VHGRGRQVRLRRRLPLKQMAGACKGVDGGDGVRHRLVLRGPYGWRGGGDDDSGAVVQRAAGAVAGEATDERSLGQVERRGHLHASRGRRLLSLGRCAIGVTLG